MALEHWYSAEGSGLRPTKLDDRVLLAIGRMFRGAAEIEDIIALYIVSVAQISEGHVTLFLGRSAISKKIEIARSFAKIRGEEELSRFRATLGHERLAAAIEFRNTIAHGALLGLTDEGRYAFRTAKQIDHSEYSITTEVNSYSQEDFENCALVLDELPAWLEGELGLVEARAKRRAQHLHPHAKAQRGGERAVPGIPKNAIEKDV